MAGGRPTKLTVDYFPHMCTHKKTMFIIEQQFGNDGYAAWFKLLELLGASEGHYYDCRNADDWEFLLAKTRLTNDICEQLLSKLAKLQAIDQELWEQHRVIWSDNFVMNLEDLYKRRKINLPQKPSFCAHKPDNGEQKPKQLSNDDDNNHQSKVEEIKEDKITPLTPLGGGEQQKRKKSAELFARFWAAYPKKRSKGDAEKAWDKLKADEQLLTVILAALERAKKSADWVKDGGQYIPYPATWLNAKGWEDEYTPSVTGAAKVKDYSFDAQRALSEVLSSFGKQNPQWSDPATPEALKAVGGLRAIGNASPGALNGQFINAFKAIKQRLEAG
jgi:hypothetical protein